MSKLGSWAYFDGFIFLSDSPKLKIKLIRFRNSDKQPCWFDRPETNTHVVLSKNSHKVQIFEDYMVVVKWMRGG